MVKCKHQVSRRFRTRRISGCSGCESEKTFTGSVAPRKIEALNTNLTWQFSCYNVIKNIIAQAFLEDQYKHSIF